MSGLIVARRRACRLSAARLSFASPRLAVLGLSLAAGCSLGTASSERATQPTRPLPPHAAPDSPGSSTPRQSRHALSGLRASLRPAPATPALQYCSLCSQATASKRDQECLYCAPGARGSANFEKGEDGARICTARRGRGFMDEEKGLGGRRGGKGDEERARSRRRRTRSTRRSHRSSRTQPSCCARSRLASTRTRRSVVEARLARLGTTGATQPELVDEAREALVLAVVAGLSAGRRRRAALGCRRRRHARRRARGRVGQRERLGAGRVRGEDVAHDREARRLVAGRAEEDEEAASQGRRISASCFDVCLAEREGRTRCRARERRPG